MESDCRKLISGKEKKRKNKDDSSSAGRGGAGTGRGRSSGRSRGCCTFPTRTPRRGRRRWRRGVSRGRTSPTPTRVQPRGCGEGCSVPRPRLVERGLRFPLRPGGSSRQQSSHVCISDSQGPALAPDCDQRKPAQLRGCPSHHRRLSQMPTKRGNFYSSPAGGLIVGRDGDRVGGGVGARGWKCAAGVRGSVCGYAAA